MASGNGPFLKLASPFNETHRGTGRSDEDVDNVVKSKRNIGISIYASTNSFSSITLLGSTCKIISASGNLLSMFSST